MFNSETNCLSSGLRNLLHSRNSHLSETSYLSARSRSDQSSAIALRIKIKIRRDVSDVAII